MNLKLTLQTYRGLLYQYEHRSGAIQTKCQFFAAIIRSFNQMHIQALTQTLDKMKLLVLSKIVADTRTYNTRYRLSHLTMLRPIAINLHRAYE